jgi:hypothetical protein
MVIVALEIRGKISWRWVILTPFIKEEKDLLS